MNKKTNKNKQQQGKKYITLDEGTDFRKISQIMTEAGFVMNHATARNQLMIAMENLLSNVGRQMGVKLDKTQLSALLHNQDVHNSLADILFVAYKELLEEQEIMMTPSATKKQNRKNPGNDGNTTT